MEGCGVPESFREGRVAPVLGAARSEAGVAELEAWSEGGGGVTALGSAAAGASGAGAGAGALGVRLRRGLGLRGQEWNRGVAHGERVGREKGGF